MPSTAAKLPKAGLRQRQKIERQNLILKVAQKRFSELGYVDTTIESIADEAGMSAVTVFNYFGSKVGLLFALVQDSDTRLLVKLRTFSDQNHEEAVEAMAQFARIILDNATNYLTKRLWRRVLAASIAEKDNDFRTQYKELDLELKTQLGHLLVALQRSGKLTPDAPIARLTETLFMLQNSRFVQYMSSDKIVAAEANVLFRADASLVLEQFSV
ncbi:MAG: TetR/AcrR family transcriptional regulator [Rhizobiaceae bacterium]